MLGFAALFKYIRSLSFHGMIQFKKPQCIIKVVKSIQINLNNKFELNKNMNDNLNNGGRRIYNIGGHGGTINTQGHMGNSLNQRIFDDLNDSMNARKFDNHFDYSQDNIENYNHNSSRLNYSTGGGVVQEVTLIKRSETEQQIRGVSFAETHANARNHPLHMKSSALSGVGKLERIDERKSQSPSRRTATGGHASTQRSQSNNKRGDSTHKQTDISNLTINSNRLEDSVKAPGRNPVRLQELTQFLIEGHHKWYGVFTKNEKELFRFWKEHVSVVYKERKKKLLMASNHQQHVQTATFSEVPLDGKPLFKSKEFKNPKLEEFGKCFEMDVAYTLQKDLEEENSKELQTRTQHEMQMKEDRNKKTRENEERIIRAVVESYYEDKKNYFISLLHGGKYRDYKHDDRLKRWYLHVAEVKMQGVGLPDLETIKQSENKKSRSHSRSTSPQKNNSLNISKISKTGGTDHDASGDTSKTEVLNKSTISKVNTANKGIQEEKKDVEAESKEVKTKREALEKKFKRECDLVRQMIFYLREAEALTHNHAEVFRIYRDCKEKAAKGLIWHKSDSNVEVIFQRFFSVESVIRRLQILYEEKCKKEPRYRHLSIFGFYLQLKPKEKQLYLVDWPVVKSERAVSTIIDHHEDILSSEQILKIIKDHYKEDKARTISIEQHLADFDLYMKVETSVRSNALLEIQQKELKKRHDQLLESVFGKEKKKDLDEYLSSKKTMKRLKELAKPKDKWKRLRILMDLKKKFRHDITLEKMIKEELKDNRVFKFPEEYDLYDDTEDKLCKHMAEKEMKKEDLGKGKALREKFKALDDKDLYYLKREVQKKRHEEREMEKYLIEKALEYLEQKKKRLQGKSVTVREFVSEVYHNISKKYTEIVKTRFPHVTFGQDPESNTYKKSYPLNFKSYFFKLVRSYFAEKKGLKRVKNPAPAFLIPSGPCRCLIHENLVCPDDCKYATFNQKVVLRNQRLKRLFKEPATYRSRVWRRRDFYAALDKVLMLNSEKANCFFEPEAGSMSRTIDLALKANPNLRKDGLLDEPDPEEFVKKLGQNFEKSHPEVYKQGVLKRAKLMAKEGKFDDALKRLYDGFNVESIKKRYDPKYMQRFFAEQLIKEKAKRLSKERESAGGLTKIDALKDQHESQKKKPEEDFENKKLIPILKEAFDLITLIEDRKRSTEQKIKDIKKDQKELRKTMRSFSTYKKSQTRLDSFAKEKVLYRTIMCPLRDKCPKDMRPRWPTSNTKAKTKFGEECPFAHHPMELQFPESIITKLSSSYNTIKVLKSKVDLEKPREAFKPTGPLFDCQGCMEKSGKHLGGPCNLCRYKEMAGKSSAKFNDKKRKHSLMKSIEKREPSELRKDHEEMKEVMKQLNLDDNFTIKFGLLKKACVLYFYGRCNDAFDQIAKAAKIIQDQREIEKQKQSLIEKRWKFKLGMDEGFEMPIPIDQIDPNKVDEKFLKKLDLQGVSVSTLKLYIEQVSPQSNEEYSKHKFLNKCVEDFYLQCEAMLEDKQNTIAKMKKQVEKLDEEADMLEAMQGGGESSPDRSPEKGGGMLGESGRRIKAKKTKMCPNIAQTGKCKLSPSRCPFAHNPIELDLIPVETKMKNLQGVIQSQTQKMKNMKPLEPWRPAKSGDVIQTPLMDMTSKNRKKKGDDGEEDEENGRRRELKKKSIFDRENIFRKPYEINE